MKTVRLNHIEHRSGSRLARKLPVTSALALMLAGLVLVSVERLAQAKPDAIITVNTLVDTVANDGVCSLREAIQSANAGMPIGNCASGAGLDTIVITATGTIVLGSDLPALVQDVVIVGPGPESLTISGNNAVRVISVTTGINVNLSEVTLANGNAASENGGAIYNRGTLTISHVTLVNNTAHLGGGISNLGSLNMTSTAVYNNSSSNVGGGIYNIGTLTVTNSALYSNTASNGGGIYSNLGVITIDRSALYGNV
ncbi:partial putative outer membrane protein PmpB, partial [uncultured bacterium]